MNNEFLEIIKTRRSCRQYKAEQITDEESSVGSRYIRADIKGNAVALYRRRAE